MAAERIEPIRCPLAKPLGRRACTALRVPLDHRPGSPTAEPLQFVSRCPGLPVASGEAELLRYKGRARRVACAASLDSSTARFESGLSVDGFVFSIRIFLGCPF